MEIFSTSGFELSALLAPELAGTAAGARQGPNADPRAAEPGTAPFSLALAAVASVEPQAATLPAGGNILPLVERSLVAARGAHPVSATGLPGHGPGETLSAALEPTRSAGAEPLAQLPTGGTARVVAMPSPIAGEPAGPVPAAPVVAADPSAASASAAAVLLDAAGAKVISTPAHAADVIRLATNNAEGSAAEPVRDLPIQRPGEQATGRLIAARDASEMLALELSKQASPAMTAADSANASAALPIARNLQSLDAGARAAETNAAMPAAHAIVPEARSAQSVDAAKIVAELSTGPEARLPGALAERLHWMIDQNLGEARIKLNPPQLGAVDIKITIADDQTFVQFTASQAGARDVIEAALPRLRDLLGAAGLELGGATVGGEATGRESSEARWSALPELESLDVIEPLVRKAHGADGRIDIYA